jgi:hypothetical protein
MSVDERRLKALEDKRDEHGLSDDEADELGRLLAERDGREYGNADSISPDDRGDGSTGAGETEREYPVDMVGRLPADQGIPLDGAPGG